MVHLFEVLFSFSHLVYNNECKPHNIKLTQSSQTSLFGSWEYSLHWKPHIFRGWISQKCAGFSSGSSWTNPLIFHILWVAEVETWLLPQEVSHGGPLWPVPVHGGVGQGEWGRKGGGAFLDWNVAFRTAGDCGEWQWPLPLCLPLLPLGPWAVNDAAPGKVPLSLLPGKDRKAEQERSERSVKKGKVKYWLGLWTRTPRFRANPSCCYGFTSQS